MSNKVKRDSPLVTSVLALHDYLAELERIGTKINAADLTGLTGEVDVEHIQKLLIRFAECGQGVSDEISNFSVQLQEARTRAETVAHGVSRQAEVFRARREEQNENLEQFRLLTERVREFNATLTQGTPEQTLSDISKLIEELQELRNSARTSRMKSLEKKAESLVQSLQAVHTKLRDAIQSQS